MSLITPDFGLLFWMLISFGLTFFVLARFGFPVITRMVDRRRDFIQKSLDAAEEANRKLAGIEAESKELLDQAQKRQAELLAAAVADSRRIVQQAREKAEKESAERIEAASRQIEIQKQKALSEMRSTVAMLSVDVAEKVLRRQIEEDGEHHSFLDRMIDEAERQADKKAN
ncbi:MAG: F0F1 ATP synthase subunit B [Tidjanibacter sp.]|nr:F0F1 ATP synthase subunit B [Tidjanibacter sp.]